jgi:hypothetical protein
VRVKKSAFDTSSADPSFNIIDIMDKPDVAVWNKIVQMQKVDGVRRLKIGPLDQNLIREDKNIVIDSANKKDIVDIIISGAKVTDKVDLSKSKSNHMIE